MRAFILLACWATVVYSRPDVGGYNYNNNNNGLLNQQQQPSNGQSITPMLHQQQQLPAEQSFATFGESQLNFANNHPAEQLSDDTVEKASSADSYQQAYQQSLQPHDGGYAYAPESTKIHKHIYVHVPPKEFEEEDSIQPHVHHQAAPKQKHYKIVFIKAPSAPSVRPPIVPPLPQNEEKTLIYVLHKKPETSQDIVIPAPAPTKPSKPEVYFIKYKTRKEEAPVYGPPPHSKPIVQEQSNNEFAAPAPTAPAPVTADEEQTQSGDIGVRTLLTTLQPTIAAEEQPQQFISELPSELYGGPTMGTIHVEDVQTTSPAATATPFVSDALSVGSNQYLAPEPTQLIENAETEQKRIPASSYGPPRLSSGRYFIKKKK